MRCPDSYSCYSGESPEFTTIASEVETRAHHCNKKKLSAKTVQVSITTMTAYLHNHAHVSCVYVAHRS